MIVKLGEQGACYATTDDAGFIPAYTVEVVDTVAAGDAFGAALAFGIGCKEIAGRFVEDLVEKWRRG